MDQGFKDKLLIDVATTQKAILVQMQDIKDDLKIHIKRSDQNEILIRQIEEKQARDINYVKKHIYFVQGALGLLSILSIIFGILRYFKAP